MKSPVKSSDADIRGSWHALKRAARKARALAQATKTPFYVLREGRVVDINRGARRRIR